MKRVTCAIAALILTTMCVSQSASAQDFGEFDFAQPARTQSTQAVSLSIPQGVALQYEYEHPLGRLGTIVGRVGADAGGAWGSSFFGDYAYWHIQPSIDIEPRFYYGLDRRERHGRSTEGNAGSFIALRTKTLIPVGYISDSDLVFTGATVLTPQWGVRRVWGGHFLFEFTTGVNFAVGWRGGVATSLALGLRFGYAF